MLQTTKDLIQLFHSQDANTPDYQVVRAYVRFIERYGSVADVEPLFDLYLEDPTDLRRQYLLEPIRIHGDDTMAEKMFQACFEDGQLKEEMYGGIFHCLGYLGYEPVKPILYQLLEQGGHALGLDECLGLLHFSCEGYEEKIAQEIRNCLGKNLFPEFVPSLLCKVPDPALIDEVYESGGYWASTDCNGGMVLGIALCGEKERNRFKSILWDERWEAESSSTGTRTWAFVGMQHQQITFRELFEDIKEAQKQGCSQRELKHRLYVLLSMLEMKIFYDYRPLKFGKSPDESYQDIYLSLFDWSTPHKDDSIIGWISDYIEDRDYIQREFYQLRDHLELKLEQEVMWKYLRT
ncbi:hypothetical protein [Thermoflavimicrobium dichotomicum]|uniref:Uncharacterized protein n=1 Tax=Thermoflavimicrobium dichotomicum TaxID=46223 RepID=A0A1I3LH77_9BACL|nr:hypothetical protein [Thermoflavimicrobium dichotomicum]SFI84102.1 hypothetical protein SAMN05421852_102193 [Thermoflavimicrobium dichotomicum]